MTQRGMDTDSSAVCGDDGAYDREAQPCAAIATTASWIGAIEAIEHMSRGLRRQARSLVYHFDQRVRTGMRDAYRHETAGSRMDARVGHEVDHDLCKAAWITMHCH